MVNRAIKCKIKENHVHEWICENQHGHLQRSRKNAPNVYQNNTEIWLKKASLSSHIERYIFVIQEEVNTNLSVTRRDRQNNRNMNCRKQEKESIQQVIAACPKLSTSMYLLLRHDKVARVVYDAIIDCKNQKKCILEIYNGDNKEIWWDKKIATVPPLKHNKPDIVYWNKHNTRFIINIAVGRDVNITKNVNLKHDNYTRVEITDFQTLDKTSDTIKYLPAILKMHGTSCIMATFDVHKYSFWEINTPCINKPCINHPLQKV